MTNEEITSRIAQGEDSRTQFKREPIGVSKLAAELAAFTNAEGGVILFGVDDGGEIVGLNAAMKKTLERDLANAANDGVRPAVYPRTEFHTINGKQVLAVHVAEGVSKPYADKTGSFWTKAGPDKRRITAREELQRLLQSSLLIHADELPVPQTGIDDIDLYHLGEFLDKVYGIPATDVLTPGKVDLPQKLQNLGFSDGENLTLAGLMLFGKDPQRHVPVNMVKAVAFVGNDPAGTRYRDSEDLRGTVRDMYKATMQFILRNLRHLQAGRGFNTLGEPEIPEGALQELVVNMFLHRDYFVASPWRVLIFDDRIELISPGCLPNHLDVEKMKMGVSVVRNPLIFSFATRELPYRGLGTGIIRALSLGADVSFVSDRDLNVFKATLVRRQLDKSWSLPDNLPENPRDPDNLPESLPVNEAELKNLPENLPEILKRLLVFMKANPSATYDEMAVVIGRTRETVRVSVRRLKEEYGLIRRTGSPRRGSWIVCTPGGHPRS